MTDIGNPSGSECVIRLFDDRVKCWSLLMETTVGRYLELADTAYKQRGGIRHQREALRTTSARRIRARMVEDIIKGAVLPPVVIGAVATSEFIESINSAPPAQILSRLAEVHEERLAIIDGMQRTTALIDAIEEDPSVLNTAIRLEVWLADSTDSLIYRMLILNTGQVPWSLKQQLQVVYEPLVNSIQERVSFTRFLGKAERRWNGGELNAESLIEAYIAFGLRRTEVETQETLADEFSRLDMADALTTRKYDQFFYPVVQMLVDFDVVISRFNEVQDEIEQQQKVSQFRQYSRGRNVFDSQPARIGFIVANAVSILGRVGMDKEPVASLARLEGLQGECDKLIDRVSEMGGIELQKFLALDVLEERVGRRPTSAVGRWERAFFESAFKVLVEENYNVPSLETCWRA